MAVTPYNLGHDGQGHSAFAPQPPAVVYTASLAASTHSSITVPSTHPKRWVAVFSYQNATDCWVAVNGTAAVPAGGTFAAAVSERNPRAYQVKAGDVIDIITATVGGSNVSVALYAND